MERVVLLQHDLAVVAPLRQGEGTIGAEVLGLGVVVVSAHRLIEGLVDGGQSAKGEHVGGIGDSPLQGDLQGQVVDDLDAHVFPSGLLGDLAFPRIGIGVVSLVVHVGFRVLNEVQHVGVVRGHVQAQGLLPGKGEVVGGDRVAVGPNAVLPQVEGVDSLVIGDVHALRGAQLGNVVLIQHIQVLVNVAQDRELIGVGGEQAVQAGGLHANADVQVFRGVHRLGSEQGHFAGGGAAALVSGAGLAGLAGGAGFAARAGRAAGAAAAGIAAGGEGHAQQSHSQNNSQDLLELHSNSPWFSEYKIL